MLQDHNFSLNQALLKLTMLQQPNISSCYDPSGEPEEKPRSHVFPNGIIHLQ